MDLGLKERAALVAAASRGLGHAVAAELAAEGASLILCARGAETLDKVAEKMQRETNVPIMAIAGDVAKAEDVKRIVDAGLKRFGHIDVLVTNAGGPPAGRFENLSGSDWDAAVSLTLKSVLELTRAVLPGMKERRWGRILNVTSIAVKQPVDNLILSNSLRAAVTGFARTLANEVAPFCITVNNILPGYTRTDRVEELARAISESEGISEAEARSRWETQIPMGRLGEPREFAALAAFLASERASYITGTSITVDGGWVKSLL